MPSKYYYDYTRNGLEEKESTPNYYKGIFKGIEAHDVIDDFLLTYNVGTAVTYLLRAGKKPNNPKAQDIEKAIHHLQFELELIKKQECI
tara:strand:+ start:944 stop:1210 length:267 start_codon:yes stop_codon:yes gene_type:complete